MDFNTMQGLFATGNMPTMQKTETVNTDKPQPPVFQAKIINDSQSVRSVKSVRPNAGELLNQSMNQLVGGTGSGLLN